MGLAPRAAFALLLAAWLLPGLLGHDPWKPDEAYSFGIVYEMLETGDWVVPSVAGEPFVEKPPLFYVTAAAFSAALAGWLPAHDAARLASALYVVLTLLFLARTATVLYGKQAGAAAALVLAGCLGFLSPSHLLITDNALVAGCSIALYGFAVAPLRPLAGGVFLGTGAGIAFLAKGLLGPGVLAVSAAALRLLPNGSAPSVAATLLAFAPWALVWPWLLSHRSPELFEEWFWANNIGRFTAGGSRFGPELDHWMYLRILPVFAFPALPLAAWTLWKAAREGRAALKDPALMLPLVLFAVTLIVLSAASSSRNIYALPLLLPLSLLAVARGDALASRVGRALDASARWSASLLALALWAAWLAFLAGWPPLAPWLEGRHPGFEPQVQAAALIAALALTAGWGAILTKRGALLGWTAGVTLVWGLTMTLWLPYLDHAKSYRGVMTQLREHLPADHSCVASHGLRESQLAMVHYFAGIVPVSAGTDAALACSHALTDGAEKLGVLLWSGSRPGDAAERFSLYALRARARP